jgi:molybdate transport system substrate-binding protein
MLDMLNKWVRIVNKKGLALFLLFLVGGVWGAEIQAQSTQEITVSAAISLKDAFEEMGKVFKEKNLGVRVLFNFGASGDLSRQIEAGAPVDIFAPAAQKDMDDINRKGLILSNSRFNFAENALVLVTPANSSIQITSIKDLQKEEVKKIVIGNPKTVPAGRYAEEVLKYFNLLERVKGKLIFAEHVRQALDYVARDEVDAGLVYSTDAMIRSKEIRIVVKATEGSHEPIIYPIAVLKGTKNETLARKFVDFILSSEVQPILAKFGFKTVYTKK